VPCCWLAYLICLHTYLILTKKSTIQLIMESRMKHQITPKDSLKNQIFKITFTKNSTDPEVNSVVKKAMYPEKDEDFESSHTETNNNLVRDRNKGIAETS
jgi:hypothetical protein